MRHSTINALFGSSRFRFLLAVLTGVTVSSACFAQDAAEMRLAAVTGPSTPEQRNVHSLFAWGNEQVLFSAGPDFIPGESYLTNGTAFEPIELPPDQGRGFFLMSSLTGGVTSADSQPPLRYFVTKRFTVTLATETLDGTHLVSPLFEASDDSIDINHGIRDRGVFDGSFYFATQNTLYRTDGSDVFTVGDFTQSGWGVVGFTQLGETIHFIQGHIESPTRTLHSTDGTAIADVDIAPATELLGPPIAKDGLVYFAANGPDGKKIYALDEAGIVSPITDFPAARMEYWTKTDDGLYFTGQSLSSFIFKLYRFDGSNVTMVTEGQLTLPEGNLRQPQTVVDGHLYFFGSPTGLRPTYRGVGLQQAHRHAVLYRVDGVTPVPVYEMETDRWPCPPLGGTQTLYFFKDRLPYAYDTQTQTTTALSETLLLQDSPATEVCPAVVAGDRLFMISGDDLYATERCPSGTVGDANLDGQVTFADFLILSETFNQSGGWQRGDFDCDNLVGFSDFLMLSANYGVTTEFGTDAHVENVPEPCEWVTVMVAVLAVGGLGRKRRLTSDLCLRQAQAKVHCGRRLILTSQSQRERR